MKFYSHWTEVPASEWHWPSFTPEEIACRGTGKLVVDRVALDRLQALRDRLGVPVIVNSAYRSPEHNAAVGGAKGSLHMSGVAFDVSMANHDPHGFEGAARAVGFTGFGFYPRSNFIHVDTGEAREWGTRFAHDEGGRTRFSEPVPAKEGAAADDVVRGLAGAAAGASAAAVPFLDGIGMLSPPAQMLAVAGALVLVVALAIVARDRLRKWLR